MNYRNDPIKLKLIEIWNICVLNGVHVQWRVSNDASLNFDRLLLARAISWLKHVFCMQTSNAAHPSSQVTVYEQRYS